MSRAVVEVTLKLPSVLKVMVGADRVRVRGANVGAALESAYEALPRLRDHLMLENGELRPHVLCLVNGVALLRDEVADAPLKSGDTLEIHQAISGG